MKSKMRWLLYAFLALVILPALGFAAWVWVTLNFSYSSGERAGQLQKISRKGWVCKTWEGELNMVVLPGGIPEKFYFTVWDDTVASAINRNVGKRVSLHYDEKVGLPTSCFGETRYYINRVAPLTE